jgi:hypothetical protein
MKARIGSTSINPVSRLAWVWNSHDPTPIAASTTASACPAAAPHRGHITKAATKGQVRQALTGSAQ